MSFNDFMISAVSTPRLSCKLQDLLTYEGIAYKRSNVPISEAINKLDRISRRIRDAEDRWVSSDHQVSSDLVDSFWTEWVSRLTDLEDVIDTIIVKTMLQKRKFFCSWMSSLVRLFSWDLSAALSSEMGRLITLSEAPRQHAPLEPTGDTSSYTPPRYVDYLVPDALDEILRDKCDELLKQLCKQKQGELDTVIAVTGAAGSGKTVLAKRVLDMKIAKLCFNCHAWVNVSGDFEARDFLVEILTQLGQMTLQENLQVNELELRLKQFSKENRCLIVVDDVRKTDDLEKLSVVLKCIVGQSRLILITCQQDVARFANGQRNPIWLRSLTDEESLRLFFKAARIEEVSFNTPESINFLKGVLRKCDGSPWAIHVLGGLLSTRDPSKWHNLIEQWSDMDLRELPTVMPAVQGLSTADKKELSSVIHPQENIFTLGYQDLSSRVRYCFLYFGLFPRAYAIPIRRLFNHWLVEGLIIPLPEEQMAPEDLMKEYVKQLISRNLIEVVKWKFDRSPKICRMPGCIWDVFHPEAEKLRLFHVHPNKADTSAGPVRRLVENAGIGDHLSLDPHIQSLRSCISFNIRRGDLPNQEIGMFLHNFVSRRGFGLLMLLDLEHVCKPVLRDTIGKFFLLKYLSLRWTSLNSLPMWVGNLPYLEILDLKHTNITSLPISFWNAKKLQRLYLDCVDMFSRKSNSGPLMKLQILSGLLICNTSSVNHCLSRFPGLKKLKVTCSPRSVGALTGSITQFNDLQNLSLRSIDEFDQLSILELGAIAEHPKLSNLYLRGPLSRDLSLPQNLNTLTLSASELEQDPMPVLGQLRFLKVLIILGKSYSGKIMTCLPGGFPELRILKLWVLENLEKWIVGERAMPLLGELEIRLCCRLHQIEGLQLITTLKKVILTNLPDEVVANVKRVTANASVQVNNLLFDPLPEENELRQE